MKEWPTISGTIDELRLASLLQDYDELERELESPDPLLSSYSSGKVVHNCNNRCCADSSRQNLLYRAGSLAEYEAHIGRRLEENRLRDEQQELLCRMAAEGMPGFLWVNVGEEPSKAPSANPSFGGRFIRLDLKEDREQSSSTLKPLPADVQGESRQPEPPAVPPDKYFKLYSVRAEALDAIPPETLPEDVVNISEYLGHVEALDANTRTFFDWYERVFAAAGAAFLLLPSSLYYVLNLGALIPISAGVAFTLSLLSCMAVLAAYLIVRVEDYRVGPAGARERKTVLWKRYRRLSPANAAAHYGAACAAVKTHQRRRRTWASNESRQDRGRGSTSTPAIKHIPGNGDSLVR